MLTAIIHGILLAFGLILPLGAQNVFVFNQGASQPKFRGAIPVIVTAACCDSLLILLAVLGVSVVVFTIPVLQTAIFVVGLAFLLYMGWSIWKSKPSQAGQARSGIVAQKANHVRHVGIAPEPACHPRYDRRDRNQLPRLCLSADKLMFTVATMAVSWIWFFALAFAGKMVGAVDTGGRILNVINKLSALVIWGVAVYIALKLFKLV